MKDDQPPSASQPGAIDWDSVRQRLWAAQAGLERGFAASPQERQAILRARAKTLAQESKAGQGEAARVEVVEFLLAQERYGFESAFVREVWPLKDLTPVPCTPPFVLGLVNLRGQIISVIDLKKFFGLPEKGLSDVNRVIVLHSESPALSRAEGMEFGVLADAILGAGSVAPEDLQAALPTLTGLRKEYLKGVTPQGTIILDAERLLADEGIVVHEEVEG